GIDGIAGSSIFANHWIVLPLKAGKKLMIFPHDEQDPMKFLQAHDLHLTEQASLPFYSIHHLILLKGKIKNSPENMDILLDTGAEHSILSAAAAKKYTHVNYPLSAQLNEHSTLSGIGGNAENLLAAENVDIQIGPLQKSFNRMIAMNLGDSSDAME